MSRLVRQSLKRSLRQSSEDCNRQSQVQLPGLAGIDARHEGKRIQDRPLSSDTLPARQQRLAIRTTDNFKHLNIMKTDKILYFAYGANLDMRGMELRCPGHKPIGRAVLKNYRLMFKSVADIEPASGHQVHGALYEITVEHLKTLDRFEGYPRFYIRKHLPVFTEEGKEVNVIVYLMNNCRQYSSPHRDYLNVILSGCRQWVLPQEHIRYIITRANNPDLGEL